MKKLVYHFLHCELDCYCVGAPKYMKLYLKGVDISRFVERLEIDNKGITLYTRDRLMVEGKVPTDVIDAKYLLPEVEVGE